MSIRGRRGAALLGLLTVAMLLAVGFAPVASAQIYEVDTLEDSPTVNGPNGCTDGPCSFRDAIERVNESVEPRAETISFGVAGTIRLEEGSLPPVTNPVRIEATSEPDYDGAPVVAIDGSQVPRNLPAGIEVLAGGDGSVVDGLAIENFGSGILVNDASEVQVCGSYIGTGLGGVEAEPNAVGVKVGPGSRGTEIGANCPESKGNVISGNSGFGIADFGQETVVVANRIGGNALGGPLPNGTLVAGGGVLIGPEAESPYLGPLVTEGPTEPANTISFNDGPGVLVKSGATQAAIRQNSIHADTGLGIQVEGASPPAIPKLETVQRGATETSVTGTLKGGPSEAYALDFFANDACDPSGAGEGQTYLGEGVVETHPDGSGVFAVQGLKAMPLGEEVLTATATGGGSTSEFSRCLPEPPAPPGPRGSDDIVLPVNGHSVALETASGTILIQLPGHKKPHPLGKGEIVPVGTIVDATNGKVTLTSRDEDGTVQTAVFYGGVFKVLQRPGGDLVVLRLLGGDFSSCGDRGGAKADARGSVFSATASGGSGRRLWGSGHGHFRTVGSHGSATVQGTIWFTEDRCDGTFFRVRRGVVKIRDFTKRRTLLLPKGHSYLAKAG